MKKKLLLIIITSFFLSCKQELSKENFIGNWSLVSNSNLAHKFDIEFYKDSMVIDNSLMYGTYSDRWKIKGSKIEQTLLRGDTTALSNENTIDFKFNLTKDTLLIKSENDSIFYIKLRKIKNGYEYFENKIGLKIELKESNEQLTSIGKNEFGFNIYLTLEKDKFITKTDYSKNLNNLAIQTFKFREEFRESEEKQLKYVLFIDKRISKKQIDSVKSKLLTNVINNVFVVYDYKMNDWNEELNWFGKFEN